MSKSMVTVLLSAGMIWACGCASTGDKNASPAGPASIAVKELRCEYRINPLGIDEVKPRLTWIMESAQRGQKQTAYQVLVASSPETLKAGKGDLWDTGKVASEQSHLLEYAGKPLASRMRCHWKVRVWDVTGKPSAWSEPALWSMGLLAASDWKGQWIGKDETPPVDVNAIENLKKCSWIWFPEGEPAAAAPIGRRFFRRTVTVPAGRQIRKADCVMAADNSFYLLVNGQWAGAGSDFKQALNLDIASLVHEGNNTIALYADNAGNSPNPAGVAGFVRVETSQGETIVVPTDGTWKTTDKELAAWETPGFKDADWVAAKVLGKLGMAPWGDVAIVSSDQQRLAARYLRHAFKLDKPIKQATAYICGLGYYELQLNGKKVGDHVLDPNLTDYSKRDLYVTYDVTDQLQRGDNAVGVTLGNGRYFAPRSSYPFGTVTYGYPKLLFQMHVEYSDGGAADIVSGDHWKLCADGPILANNDYDGEEYDARKEQAGWSTAKFDDSKWDKPMIVKAPGGELVAQMAEPARVTLTLKPKSMKELRPGVFVYDMGQNMVGWVQLRVKGPAGTIVRLRFAESLDKDGALYMANLRSAKCTDIYTLKGDANGESYEPRFTYHGFQFVEITGYPGKPDLNTIEGCVVHTGAERMGEFACSNALINRVYKNIIWGVRGNLRTIPTDCPQRDERQGWLGDIANESKQESFEFNLASFYTKWLNDIRDAQNKEGNLPDVAPPYWVMYSNNMTWPGAYVIIPSWFYELYGDLRPIERHYPAVVKWLDYMAQYLKDGIMPKDTYGDWCVPPEKPELIHSADPNRKTAPEVLGTSYYYMQLKLAERYATLLGKVDEAKKFAERAEPVKAAFNKKFFDEQNHVYSNGTQTAGVLPLTFDMVPADQRTAVFEKLVENIVIKNSGHLATGLVGGQWLMRTLTDNGRVDVAYRLATNKDYPSWGYMAEKGATTIWELWNGDTADPAMNSRNHLMLVGDLGIWLYETLAGIKPDGERPGFKHIVMKPTPVSDLKSAKASHKSMYGTIISDWKIDGDAFVWNVTVPVNTTATIYVPAADAKTVTEGGRPAEQSAGVKFVRGEKDRVVYEIGSGSYIFRAPRGK